MFADQKQAFASGEGAYNRQYQNEAATKIIDKSAIEAALDRLQLEIANAGNDFEALDSRLVPVSRQGGSVLGGASEPCAPVSCQMEDRISSMARSVANLSESIRSARESLCI